MDQEKLIVLFDQIKTNQAIDLKEKIPSDDSQITKSQKTILSKFKNTLSSKIAFKLNEILPEVINSAYSQVYPFIHKGISDAINQSLPDLEAPLLAGFSELRKTQLDLARNLESLEKHGADLIQKIERIDKAEVRFLIDSGIAAKIIEKFKEEDLFRLGFRLFDLSLDGNKEAAELLNLVSRKVPHGSEKFPEFYIRVSSTNCELVKRAQEVLDSLF